NINEDNFDESMLKLLTLAQQSASNQERAQNRLADPGTSSIRPMIKKKVVLLGESGVGKTSLIQRYVLSMFSEKYHTTVGVIISKKFLKMGDQEICQIHLDGRAFLLTRKVPNHQTDLLI